MRKFKQRFSSAILAGLSCAIPISNFGACPSCVLATKFNPGTDLKMNISELVEQINSSNPNEMQIQLQLKNIGEILSQSSDCVGDSKLFLDQLLLEINTRFGTLLTLSELVKYAKENSHHLQITGDEAECYFLGLNALDTYQNEQYIRTKCYSKKKDDKEKKTNVWGWLVVATLTLGAVALSIANPEVAPAVISGAVEIGKAFIQSKK